MKRTALILLLATVIGLLVSTRLLANDASVIGSHAGELACQMDDLRDVFRKQFRQSANYGELRAVAWDVRGHAKKIERLARSGRTLCEIGDELAAVRNCLRILDLEVAQARFRASAGMDPPLSGCTLHVDARLAGACELLRCMEQAWYPTAWQPIPGSMAPGYPPATGPSPRTPTPARWQALRPPVYGQQPEPDRGGGLPSQPAPGWNPDDSPGRRNNLPPGGTLEEIGPPLSGRSWQDRERGPASASDGFVIRIGGTAIHLR